MDAKKLTRGEVVSGVAGIALIIISVIPQWGSVSVEGLSFGNGSDGSFSLWETGGFGVLPKLAAFLGMASVVLVLVRATGAVWSIPSVTYLALGVAATLLMLMGVAVGPSFQGAGPIGIEETRGPLLYAGAALCAVILFGGWLHLQSEELDDFGNRSTAPPPM